MNQMYVFMYVCMYDVFIVDTNIQFCIRAHLFKSIHTQNKRMYWSKYDSALYLFIPRIYNKKSWMVYISSGIIQDCFVYAPFVYLRYVYYQYQYASEHKVEWWHY
jgi:hypothetical protein